MFALAIDSICDFAVTPDAGALPTICLRHTGQGERQADAGARHPNFQRRPTHGWPVRANSPAVRPKTGGG